MAINGEQVCLQILTPLPLTSKEEGQRVLRLWQDYLPECLPDKFGNWEPIDQSFDLSDRDAILQRWKWPFLATKRKPRMNASVFMRKGELPLHAFWNVDLGLGDVPVNKLSTFLQRAATELEADFACLTLLTENEIEVGRRNGTVHALDKKGTRFAFNVYSQDLQRCLPDVYWITIFGAPYVQLFGEDKLLNVPTFKVESLDGRRIALQLTSNLDDVRMGATSYVKARECVKAFLGSDAFFSAEREGPCKHLTFMWK